ncbi:hypothetical protein CF319_g3513 [Tilletia indica]|nr:hypothetical protein CF319_g3513 [Tilletia indica]
MRVILVSYLDADVYHHDPVYAPPFPLLSLPWEIIRSIFVYCDYGTLQALRRSCKSIKNAIDNDALFDRLLFRNRPFTNPVLTTAELKKIKRRAMNDEDSQKDSPLHERDLPTPVDRFIRAHPAFDRFAWSTDMDWTEIYLHYLMPLGVEAAAVLSNECATSPPVRTLEVLVSRRDIGLHTLLRGGVESQSQVAEVGIDDQQERDEHFNEDDGGNEGSTFHLKQVSSSTSHQQQAVRIKDVVKALARIADEWKRRYPYDLPFGDQYVPSSYWDTWPCSFDLGVYIIREGRLRLHLRGCR